jgi:hypothetical protein
VFTEVNVDPGRKRLFRRWSLGAMLVHHLSMHGNSLRVSRTMHGLNVRLHQSLLFFWSSAGHHLAVVVAHLGHVHV